MPSISTTEIIALIGGIALGWTARGVAQAALVQLGTKLLASGIGKKAVLETLAKGIDKLGGDNVR